jgi:hypothetical protein
MLVCDSWHVGDVSLFQSDVRMAALHGGVDTCTLHVFGFRLRDSWAFSFWWRRRFDRTVSRLKTRRFALRSITRPARAVTRQTYIKALCAGTSAFRRGRMAGSCFKGQFSRDTNGECIQYHPEPICLVSVLMLRRYHIRSTEHANVRASSRVLTRS